MSEAPVLSAVHCTEAWRSARRGLGRGRCSTAARTVAPEHIWDPFASHRLENLFLGSTFLASWGGYPERQLALGSSNPKGPGVRECRDVAEICMSQLGKERKSIRQSAWAGLR